MNAEREKPGNKRKTGLVTIVFLIIIAAAAAAAAGTWLTLTKDSGTPGQGGPVQGAAGPGGSGAPGQAAAPGGGSRGAPGAQARAGSGAGARTQTPMAGTAVEVQVMARDTVSTFIRTSGDITAGGEVEVFPDTGGLVVEYRIEEGQRVSRGQTIAMIDPSKPGDSYSASPVMAPVGGTVVSAPRVRGERVSTQSVMAVIGDLADLKIEALVPERYVGLMQTGLPAQISFQAWPDESFPARVSRIGTRLDASSRTLPVSLSLVRPDPRIKAGMFADVRIITAVRENVPVIPREAVVTLQTGRGAFVVGDDNIARLRSLETGLAGSDLLEVLEGIEPGERVVVKGQTFLEDGDVVRIIEAASSAGSAGAAE